MGEREDKVIATLGRIRAGRVRFPEPVWVGIDYARTDTADEVRRDQARAMAEMVPVIRRMEERLLYGVFYGFNFDEPHRPYFRDGQGRRWLLDGSGDVA